MRSQDVAFKVVGVGSVGTFCAVGLFMSGDGAPVPADQGSGEISARVPRAEIQGSSGSASGRGSARDAGGERRLPGLDGGRARSGRYFYVRQLKNRRLGSIGEVVEERALVNYAHLCGRTLARAHARSADPAVLAGYMGKSGAMDDALASFAMAYADRTQERLRSAHEGEGIVAEVCRQRREETLGRS